MNRRFNNKVSAPTVSNGDRPQSNGVAEQNMWSSMLESVASGKKLPEKTIIVLGLLISTSKTAFILIHCRGKSGSPERIPPNTSIRCLKAAARET